MTIFFILFWLFMSAIYCGLETGFYSLNPIRLRLHLEQKDSMYKMARRLEKLLEDKQSLICMTLIYTNLSHYFATSIATAYILSWNFSVNGELLSTLIMTPIIFLFSETIPKNIFRTRADHWIYYLSYLIEWCKIIITPLIWILKQIIRFFSFLFHIKKEKEELYWSRSQIIHLFSASAEDGLVTKQQNEIAHNIIAMKDDTVEKNMIPIKKIGTLTEDFTFEMVMQKTKETNFTDFPVIQKNTCKIIGIARFYDTYYNKKVSILPATCIEPSCNVRDALLLCTQNKQHILVVTDSNHCPIGLITKQILFQYLLKRHTNHN